MIKKCSVRGVAYSSKQGHRRDDGKGNTNAIASDAAWAACVQMCTTPGFSVLGGVVHHCGVPSEERRGAMTGVRMHCPRCGAWDYALNADRIVRRQLK